MSNLTHTTSLTIGQALENFNTFKSRYEKGSVSLIAAGVVVCSTYTNEKDAKKALQEIFNTESSSEAEMRDAAIRLFSFHKNDVLAIIQGEKSASAATNALTDYVLSFASDSGAIYGKDEHERRLLLPKLEHFRKAPKTLPMQENESSKTSENSEKQTKEEKKAKTALQLTNEALALLDRVFSISDETSIYAEEALARFIVAAAMDKDTAGLTPPMRLAHDRIQSALKRLEDKGEVTIVYHQAA